MSEDSQTTEAFDGDCCVRHVLEGREVDHRFYSHLTTDPRDNPGMSLDRVVSLKIDGDIAKGGRVPIQLLAKKLNALQEVLLGTASAVRPTIPKRKRKDMAEQIPDRKKACELRFKESRINCLVIDTELAPAPHALFPDQVDLGFEALELAGEGFLALTKKDDKWLERLFPDPRKRSQFLHRAKPLTPSGDYSIQINTPSQSVALNEEVRKYIETLEAQFTPPLSKSTRLVTGTVVTIESDHTPAFVVLRVNNRRVPCYYTKPEIAETVQADVTVGTLVEAIGEATLTKRQIIRKIDPTDDLRVVRPQPVHWSRVAHDDRAFVLNEPLEIEVRFDGESWEFEAAHLGVIGQGEHRQAAADDFRMDFMAMHDRIAQSPDDRLTSRALEIKKAFLALVSAVEVPE